MTLVLISLCCRSDNLGITSFVRALNLREDACHRLPESEPPNNHL